MAKILFGVMGDALGHINQALAVTCEMPEHEFLFVGGGKVLELKKMGYRVEAVPVPGTYYKNNRVDISATVRNALRVLAGRRKTVDQIVRIIHEFQPDVILTAYEYFTPLAARKIGIPCVSINNQHAVTKCVGEGVQDVNSISRFLFEFPLRAMFTKADFYMVNTFCRLHPKDMSDTRVFPPLQSPIVKDFVPEKKEHALVYQTSPTFKNLVKILAQLPGKFIIYGTGQKERSGDLVFRAPSRDGFLEDLASCRYFITNGGHNGISEALYFGKPVLSFPIRLAYEQYFNAYMLAFSGYGAFYTGTHPSAELFRDFETQLEQYRARIPHGGFIGNEKIVRNLNEFIQNGKKRL